MYSTILAHWRAPGPGPRDIVFSSPQPTSPQFVKRFLNLVSFGSLSLRDLFAIFKIFDLIFQGNFSIVRLITIENFPAVSCCVNDMSCC